MEPPSTVRFVVQAARDPGTLLRLLEHLALRSYVPDSVQARCHGDLLTIEIAVTDVDAGEARIVAAKMESLFVVDRVLLELEGADHASVPA